MSKKKKIEKKPFCMLVSPKQAKWLDENYFIPNLKEVQNEGRKFDNLMPKPNSLTKLSKSQGRSNL